MGNCLVLQDKVVRVMKTDGKVLEYKTPIKVHQVLSDYVGHAISDAVLVARHLGQDTDMICGKLYYLLPLPEPSVEFDKKMIQYSNPMIEEREGETGVVRIKLVISKKELEVMLRKGGVSVGDLVSQLWEKDASADEHNRKGWKPVLDSIPEVN